MNDDQPAGRAQQNAHEDYRVPDAGWAVARPNANERTGDNPELIVTLTGECWHDVERNLAEAREALGFTSPFTLSVFDLLERLTEAWRKCDPAKANDIAACFSRSTGGLDIERAVQLLGVTELTTYERDAVQRVREMADYLSSDADDAAWPAQLDKPGSMTRNRTAHDLYSMLAIATRAGCGPTWAFVHSSTEPGRVDVVPIEDAPKRDAPGAWDGPFTAGKDTWSARELGDGEMLAVMDGAGEMFCYLQLNDCAGMDKAAAKARATRIAECLNRLNPVVQDALGRGDWSGYWSTRHGFGYLLNMDMEPDLREVAQFNARNVAERCAELLNRHGLTD